MKRHFKRILLALITPWILLSAADIAMGENIDPDDDNSQYAWGEAIGWINFEPDDINGASVTKTSLSGLIWAENAGWIDLNPTGADGVRNDGSGRLSGFA